MSNSSKRMFFGVWALIIAASMAIIAVVGAKGMWYAVVGIIAAFGYAIIGYVGRKTEEQRAAAGDQGLGGGPVQQPPPT